MVIMCDTKKSCYYKIFVILLKGDKTYLLARRDIKKGEEVTDFYGQHFFITPRNERQDQLGFKCLFYFKTNKN